MAAKKPCCGNVLTRSFYLIPTQSGAFSRNAGHVLQATANTDVKGRGMAFQEYHPDFPHKQYTMGYAGEWRLRIRACCVCIRVFCFLPCTTHRNSAATLVFRAGMANLSFSITG
jgi:hypothetical protein